VPNTTLILIAHGSRNPQWRASLEELAAGLRRRVGPDRLQLAYMEFTSPTLAEAGAAAARAGAKRIRVLPLFLTAAGHVDRNIRPLVDELRQAYPELEVQLLPPMGRQPLFAEFLHQIAVEQTE
jgi:sirohydrochlorin cobaltochelatase